MEKRMRKLDHGTKWRDKSWLSCERKYRTERQRTREWGMEWGQGSRGLYWNAELGVLLSCSNHGKWQESKDFFGSRKDKVGGPNRTFWTALLLWYILLFYLYSYVFNFSFPYDHGQINFYYIEPMLNVWICMDL